MSLPSFKPSQRRLLLGSAIALALFATPFSYDFDHHQWQPNQAHAKSCFVAGTRILMADGSERPIETLQAGEQVLDQHGQINRILAVERVILGNRRLYGLNRLPPFFTAEHPFLSTRGWVAIAPAMTRAEQPTLAVQPLFTGMRILCGPAAVALTGNLALAAQPAELLVESLYWVDSPPTTALFNLILDGSHSYIANSLIVHNKGGDGGSGGNSGSGGGNSGGGGSNSGSGGGNSGGSNSSNSGNNSGGGGNSSQNGNNGGGDDHSGGHGSDDSGRGEDAGGRDDKGRDAVDANGNKLRGDGSIDDNGVDAVDANGNKLRGDGSIDDNGVDAVDANGNKLRGDGSVDDNGVDTVDANGNKLRGDGSIDDNGVDAVDANGNKLRGDGSVDDSLLPPPSQP
ncbi:Hint domain-containing homing endonuclease [Aeromonas sp. Marseille-Q5825]|uniref:Hint domain-containing homing endonuclease n=1 Tax=Aeromonas sp. Marseille-Q5825 TaxID=2972767 RepID=UPI0021C77456|nr:Hint domain-containing homing endonuclease [Aeromonas sp. Marseille-Q5825]